MEDPFEYELRADDVVLGSMASERDLDDSGWTRLRLDWTQTTSGQVTLALYNMDLTLDDNDHLLDDISLIQLAP